MKAIICTGYGPPEVLQLAEVAKPTPKNNEILIKIQATSVTASDCIVRGFKLPRWHPLGFMMGLVIGFGKPRNPILGMVLAGEVEAVGKNVARFKVGDQVYGSTIKSGLALYFGTYAEYKCLPEASCIMQKPANLTDEEAAAVPYGGLLASYYLHESNIQQRSNVLIYGASGAIGTAAVQIAKYYGATVTGVCSTTNIDLVKSLGADLVLDYTQTDSVPAGAKYDLVLDAVGKKKHSKLKDSCQQALTTDGKSLSVDDGSPQHSLANLEELTRMIEANQFKAVIDRTYSLEEMVDAHRYVDGGHKKGNVVIQVV